jgi:hypothetical protein
MNHKSLVPSPNFRTKKMPRNEFRFLALLGAASLVGCANPIDVKIELVAPCDQQSAIQGVGAVQVTVDGKDLEAPQTATYSTKNNQVGEVPDLPLSSGVMVSVDMWPGEPTEATLESDPKTVAKSLPLDLTEESDVEDPLNLRLLAGELNTFGSVATDDGTCPGMANARHGHTATYVPKHNKVLIVGGALWSENGSAQTLLDKVELYDPQTGVLESLTPMTNNRAYHTATALPDGRVLVVGGFGIIDGRMVPLKPGLIIDLSKPEGERYEVLIFKQDRAHHTATLLDPQPVVVIAGGCNGNGCTPQAVQGGGGADPTQLTNPIEIFDYSTNTITAIQSAFTPRAMHAATALEGGRVLFTGGINGSAPVCTVEFYSHTDPNAPVKTSPGTSNLGACPARHAQVSLGRNRVAIIGGYTEVNNGIPSGTLSAQIVYWNTEQGIEPVQGALLTPRAGHAAWLMDDNTVLVVGGELGNPAGTAAEQLVPDETGLYIPNAELGQPAGTRAYMGTTKMPNNQVLISGGSTNDGSLQSSNLTEIFFGR